MHNQGRYSKDSTDGFVKNVREDVSEICYPATIKSGSEPAFMTTYTNEARRFTGPKHINNEQIRDI